MRRYWLLFAQAVTVCLAIVFTVSTLRPDWLKRIPMRQYLSVRAVPPAPAAQPTAPVSLPKSENLPLVSYSSAVAQAAAAVVNIYTSKEISDPASPLFNAPDFPRPLRELPGFSGPQRSTALGSGVVVRPDGYVLTNFHVIEAADQIEVALTDGRETRAELVGADPDSDLAVLKVDLPDLSSITFHEDHEVRVGDVVLAIGNPFGVGQTTTMGIVSALGRNRLGINIYENFIQTDAAINPGNSGGALIDTQGRLIGINTAIYSQTGGSLGIGFAIPASAARTIMDQIISHGSVTRGWLGLEPQDITTDLARAFELDGTDGIIVARVLKGSPAWKSGLRVGDVIVGVNEEAVADTVGFLDQIARLVPKEDARIEFLRGGQEFAVEVEVGVRPRVAGRER